MLGPDSSAMAASRRMNPPLVGRTLCHTYRVDRLVARGGMGAVYEAEHLRLNCRVAVKVLLPQHAQDPSLLRRFRREAEIIAQLGHPHVVRVLDVDQSEDDQPFFVMEYLEGETGAQRLRRTGPLPILEAIAIALDASSALSEVHSCGIVHCDLKPTNLFLMPVRGRPDFVKLLDFGVSTQLSRDGDQRSSERAGTAGYMAPEQIRIGSPLGPRADQFALAAILYELLSGKKAFDGRSGPEILAQTATAEPRPLSEVATWIPDVFDPVLSRALAKDPAERYSGMAAFAWALETALAQSGHDGRAMDRRPGQGRYSLHLMGEGIPARAAPSPEPPTNVEGRPPSTPARPRVHPRDPKELLVRALRLKDEGALDDAVECAEKLLELAIHERVPAALRVLTSSARVLEAIFQARVGPPERMLAARPLTPNDTRRLSPRALELLACVSEPAPVVRILEVASIPRRDCVRLLAGLLRRGLLTSVDTDRGAAE